MSALGKLLEGAFWFAALSLATTAGLTFVPDGAWESFPSALRPVRAKLAEFGVAPSRYRADSDAEEGKLAAGDKIGENGGIGRSDETGKADVWREDDWQGLDRARIGERWRRVREVERTVGADERRQNVAPKTTAEEGASERRSGAETSAFPEVANVAPTGKTTNLASDLTISDAAPWGSETNVVASPTNADGGETWGGDAIPPFVDEFDAPANAGGVEIGVANGENETAFPDVGNLSASDGVDEASVAGGVLSDGGAESGGNADAAPGVDAANGSGNGFDGAADFNAPSGLLEQADAALADGLNAEANVANAPPVDEAAELRAALTAASTATTPEEIKTVFETLNRIRNERGARLPVADSQALDAALDRLAFDVFYNPAQAILEPRWQSTVGESLASIAERLGTTPETLAEINGLKTAVDAPLPIGTILKTVRGPVSAEISIAKKELTLRFNGLYAGRFALGVPESSANLRGDFRVVEKLANPNCDAVDANGQTISIPGGSPENPLGSVWIALDGGVGLQGTNRPELVGQTISENGGFVFSNREIAQLSVLLPVGAVVAIVD